MEMLTVLEYCEYVGVLSAEGAVIPNMWSICNCPYGLAVLTVGIQPCRMPATGLINVVDDL